MPQRCLTIVMNIAKGLTVEPSDEQIWTAHGHELLRYARALVGRDDAHDIVVTAFLRVRRGGWQDIDDPRRYLYRAVTNEAHNIRRGDQRRRARDTHGLLPLTTANPETQLDVRIAVAQLSVKQRAVVYLAYWRDLPAEEICDLLEISRSSVRRHLDRAVHHLRKALA